MPDNPNLPSAASTIVLGVDDLGRSVIFYRDVLELELKGQHGDLAFFALGNLMLMLSRELGKRFTPIAGAMEVVMPVASVTTTHGLLTGRGCSFLNEPREVMPGSWATTLIDPDGHKLTLMGGE